VDAGGRGPARRRQVLGLEGTRRRHGEAVGEEEVTGEELTSRRSVVASRQGEREKETWGMKRS
jgi:hypothetical protein